MPTPNPSLIPSIISSSAALFTDNWTVMLTAAIALIGIIVLPTIIARGGLHFAVKAIKRVFGAAGKA